jgi:hypothetical protein
VKPLTNKDWPFFLTRYYELSSTFKPIKVNIFFIPVALTSIFLMNQLPSLARGSGHSKHSDAAVITAFGVMLADMKINHDKTSGNGNFYNLSP